jgi:ADP-ribose pyrophosphatase YjhB (NUDIX family)
VKIESVDIVVRAANLDLLLQIRDRHAKIRPFMWGFWGGRVAPCDVDAIAAALRELKEELDVDAERRDLHVLCNYINCDGQLASLIEYRRAVTWKEFSVREGAGAAFFGREDIQAIPASPDVVWAVHNVQSLF